MDRKQRRFLFLNELFQRGFYKVIPGMSLIKVRIVFLTAAFIHLVVTAVVTLSIDTRVDGDQRIRDYFYVRWKLITCWFNVVTLVYLPIRLYTDIRTQTQGEENEKITKILNQVTDVIMTGILLPVTAYGDITFWSVYLTNPTVIAPLRIFEYLPYWSQHSLHSVSFAVVVMDLLLTPRRRPKNLKPRLTLLTAFVLGYTAVIYICLWRGEIVYAFLENASATLLMVTPLISLAICILLFYTQWLAIDYIWRYKLNNEPKSNLKEIEKKS